METAVNIATFLRAEDIALDLSAANKQAAIEAAAELLCPGEDACRKAVLQALLAREQLGSTGLGRGVALPHARSNTLAATSPCLQETPEMSAGRQCM